MHASVYTSVALLRLLIHVDPSEDGLNIVLLVQVPLEVQWLEFPEYLKYVFAKVLGR